MARILTVYNGEKIVEPENGVNFTLEELYIHTKSTCVERVVLDDKYEMWVDEEGKLNNKPINVTATDFFHFFHGKNPDYIVGDAFVCRRGDVL